MSEAQISTISQDVPTVDSVVNGANLTDGQQGAGAMLKQAREARGLHIAALAVLLKVPVKKLEALESERFDFLPDAVFARALASSVCRTLKIDPVAILARLPQTPVPKLRYQRTGSNQPFRSPNDGPSPSVWVKVSRPAVLAGMLLLISALVLVFLPAIKTGIGGIRLEASTAKNQNMGAVKSMPATEVTVPSLLPTSSVKVLSGDMSSPSFVVIPNSPPASDVVVFAAKTESWVEATDAKGQVVLSRTLAAGEVVGASGALPLKVIVGRANATEVRIRGKVFDVNAVAKDNVARFEVK
jgi:cytoskeleton protein RodZ